jgi:hypothetical protein
MDMTKVTGAPNNWKTNEELEITIVSFDILDFIPSLTFYS